MKSGAQPALWALSKRVVNANPAKPSGAGSATAEAAPARISCAIFVITPYVEIHPPPLGEGRVRGWRRSGSRRMRGMTGARHPRGVVRCFHLPLLRDRVGFILAQPRSKR